MCDMLQARQGPKALVERIAMEISEHTVNAVLLSCNGWGCESKGLVDTFPTCDWNSDVILLWTV